MPFGQLYVCSYSFLLDRNFSQFGLRRTRYCVYPRKTTEKKNAFARFGRTDSFNKHAIDDARVAIQIQKRRKKKLQPLSERLSSLGIMEAQFLKPLSTIVLCDVSKGFQGVSSIEHTWLPRNANLSDSYKSDRCSFFSPGLIQIRSHFHQKNSNWRTVWEIVSWFMLNQLK